MLSGNRKEANTMDEKKNVIVICSTENKLTFKDCAIAGFGFYIGWTTARTLKYLLLARNIKRD